MRSLDLANNAFQSVDVIRFLDVLAVLPLTSLDLSYNYLGKKCTDHIIENLLESKLFRSLKYLYLRNTKVTFADERLMNVFRSNVDGYR